MRIVLLVILLGFPAVDIFVTVRFAQWIGIPAWILFAAGTLAGWSLLRNERMTFRAKSHAALSGRAPLLSSLLDSGRKVLAGILFALPNILPKTTQDMLRQYTILRPVTLGLDLQGGSNVLMEVDRKELVDTLIKQCQNAGVKRVVLVTPPIYDFVAKKDEFNYDTVMTEYAKWEMELKVPGVRIIDLHTAMRKARDSRTEPFSRDRVHPGDDGHLLMARTVLAGLGVKVSDETVKDIQKDPLYKLVAEKRAMRSAQWMKHIGYTREKTVSPGPLGTVEADAAKLQERIDTFRRMP